LQKFEPSRGLRFATYATYWVRALMLDHIVKNWSVVRGGSRALDTRWFFRLRRERVRVGCSMGFGAGAEAEIATRLGLPADEVHEMVQRLDLRDGSLDAPIRTDSHVTFGELLPAPDDQEHSLNELRIQGSVKGTVARALATLDPRERCIAERRWMADASERSSLAEIGRDLGVSRERAHQLEARMKRKLHDRIPAFGDAVVNEWLEAV
jgi:RNA polymerase sigma-32 factor